jgi:multicomponent Na+:H+ antiporter subunit E
VTRFLLSVATLTTVYVLTLARFDAWDLATGALIATALLALFRKVTIGRRTAQVPGLSGRVAAFVPFAGRVLLDTVVGAWQVALVIVGLRPLRHANVVSVPIQERSHRGIAVTALVTTLSPGAYFIGVDWDRQLMLFHFLDASDPEQTRRSVAQFYERYQRRVFP